LQKRQSKEQEKGGSEESTVEKDNNRQKNVYLVLQMPASHTSPSATMMTINPISHRVCLQVTCGHGSICVTPQEEAPAVMCNCDHCHSIVANMQPQSVVPRKCVQRWGEKYITVASWH
jgi:hypothetical protein